VRVGCLRAIDEPIDLPRSIEEALLSNSLDSSEHASNERRQRSTGRKPIPDVIVEKTR